MNNIGIGGKTFEQILLQHKCESGYGYGGFGGSLKDPTPSLLDRHIELYNNENNLFEIPKKYIENVWVTNKIDKFCEKFIGEIIDYILYTRDIKRIRKVRVLRKLSNGGRYYIEYEPIS